LSERKGRKKGDEYERPAKVDLLEVSVEAVDDVLLLLHDLGDHLLLGQVEELIVKVPPDLKAW